MDNLEPKRSIVIGKQIRKARELLQFTPEEVAEEINVTKKDIMDWEEERTRPNLSQLEKLAKFYGREIDYFLRETPSSPEKIEFRGKPEKVFLKDLSKETKVVLARFDELCRTALEFENLLEMKREIKIPCFKQTIPPKTIVKTLREKLNVGGKSLPNLREILENEGVRIFELPIPENEFSGFSFWHSEYGPCILINANEPKGRRNFTLAHELAHLLYNHGSSLCYIPIKLGEVHKGLEYKANQVAIELLLPKAAVVEDFRKRSLSSTPSQKELAQMAYYKWSVSIQALGYRLENLGLIEEGHTDSLWETKPHFKRKKGPRTPTWEKQLGKQFVEISIKAHEKGLISIGKLAHSLGISIRKSMQEIERRNK